MVEMGATKSVIDSKERVAFDLMREIFSYESESERVQPDPRTYFLTLYQQCLKIVRGQSPSEVLSEPD